MLMGHFIPDLLEELGKEIGNAWPIIILIGAVVGIGLKGLKLLRKTIDDIVKPIAEDIHKRLENIENKLYPDDGGSIIDKLDSIVLSVAVMQRNQVVIQATIDAFYDTSDDAIYRTDVHGMVIQCNQAYLDFWGFEDMAEARSSDWMSQVETPGLAAIKDRIQTIIDSPGQFTYSYMLKDGRSIRVVGRPVFVENMFDGYIGYIYDSSASHHTKLFGDN